MSCPTIVLYFPSLHLSNAQRILKAHRAFKKNVKSNIRAGDFDDFFGDRDLPDFDDDDSSSELEPDDALNAG